jgi:hypothetical protein
LSVMIGVDPHKATHLYHFSLRHLELVEGVIEDELKTIRSEAERAGGAVAPIVWEPPLCFDGETLHNAIIARCETSRRVDSR